MSAVYCNPLDLSYRFQDIVTPGVGRSVHREAADPSVVRYRDRFYMFASMSRGFWHSDNLADWHFVPTEKLPPIDYAPDVRVIRDALYICASRAGTPSPFFRSLDPLQDDFVEVSPGTFPFWDPNLFEDVDGSTYLYWGCSDHDPIFGAKIDLDAFTAEPRVPLLSGDPVGRAWERTPGSDAAPWVEGAWMTLRDARYYLQYAAPGTELHKYADGYAVGDSPLGPFEYSPHSPFSSKPGGFINGAGHGSTFQDRHDNWWHVATMTISVNHTFERRIGLFPAGFDEDGVLFCNQNFGDYPTTAHDRPFDPWSEASPRWMLLSYKAETSSSSAAEGHPSELSVDESVRTWWGGSNAWCR